MRDSKAPTSLSIAGVSKRYGETVALRDVSIAFQGGTVHSILGENGSGKSTLVKLLSGIVSADSGSVVLDGRPLAGRTPLEFAAKGFATVFQEVLIAPDRSVADNVLLGIDGLFTRRIPRGQRSAAASSAIARISRMVIDPEAIAGELTLAAKQIVVIARALARDPRILILDEATAALDHSDRDTVFSAIEAFARAGGLVLFISHRMDEVTRLSDRISILRSGQLVSTLARDEVRVEAILDLMAPERPVGAHRA